MTQANQIEVDNSIYGNVKECIILFENGTKKVFSSNGVKGRLTVNVLNHHIRDSGFVEMVLKQYREARTLPELAAKCGFNSTKTFTRYFRKYFNTTPKQWLLEMKKEEMIEKLRHTRLTTRQIAEELEFSNLAYFSDFCLRKTGKRPEEIRNGE